MPIPYRKDIKEQLVELLSLKGPMTTTDVYAVFIHSWQLTDAEISQKRGGGALYKHEIRWAHQDLVQEGIIENSKISGRGIWKLKNNAFIDTEAYEEESFSDFTEGTVKRVVVNAYERNQKARDKCLDVHGYACAVCDFDFESVYGSIGKNFIHVHHLIEISTIGKEYIIDPIKDMTPVCPNCHNMLHRSKPALTINELKNILEAVKLHKLNP